MHRTFADNSIITPDNGQRKPHIISGFGPNILTPLGQKPRVTEQRPDSQLPTPTTQLNQHLTVEQLALEQESPIDTTIYLCAS